VFPGNLPVQTTVDLRMRGKEEVNCYYLDDPCPVMEAVRIQRFLPEVLDQKR
jgi:hypothetical protein